MPKAYRYEVVNGAYVITGYSTDVNFHNIHKIIRKCKPKGMRSYYEELEMELPYPSYKRFKVLIKRSEITFRMIESLLFEETVQNTSVSQLIQDEELLGDMGIKVLTVKHYYPMPYPHVVDEYKPYKEDDINDELINHLKEISDYWLEKYKVEKVQREEIERRTKHDITWHEI